MISADDYFSLIGVLVGGGVFEAFRRLFRLKFGFNSIKSPILVDSRSRLIAQATFQHIFQLSGFSD